MSKVKIEQGDLTVLVHQLRSGAQEIEQLRATIRHLQPKAEAYDNLSSVLRLLPQPSQGYSEDVAFFMKNLAQDVEQTYLDASTEGQTHD